MAENERLIIKMLLQQKTELLTSVKAYESSSVGSYEFPETHFAAQPTKSFPDAVTTQFPSDRAMAATFNLPLVQTVWRAAGEESRTVNPYGGYLVTDDEAKENVSDNYFYTAKFSEEKIKGLMLGRHPVMFEDVAAADEGDKIRKRLFADVALSAAPTFFLVKTPEEAEKYAAEYPDRLWAAFASTPEETARYFFAGCSFVYLKSDFKEALDAYLAERTYAYRAVYQEYRAGKMTLTEFDGRKRSLQIFDEGVIDAACDRIISALRAMKEAGEEKGSYASVADDREARFDEVNHQKLARRAARQSVVLLKNEGAILPLAQKAKVAIIGEYAESSAYAGEFYTTRPTEEQLPFEAINAYELDAVGFTAGYRKGEAGRTDLMANAFNLSRDADVSLVYLFVPGGEKRLPREQEELLELLYRDRVRVVAVVDSDGVPDLSFADKCQAVLLTARGGQEIHRAVLDIVTGEFSPSGRLTESVGFTAENGQSAVAYPFGFGLTYTSFEYRNLKINDEGISCTVVNTGNYDAFATVQMYVRKAGSAVFADKTLRGIAKVFVKKGDGMRVEIPFDKNTFQYYNEKKKRYCIDGGEYEIFVCENYLVEKLQGTIALSDYAEPDKAKSEVVKQYAQYEEVAFSPNKKDGGEFKEKKGISFGIKLFLAIVLALYSYGVLAVFALGIVVPVGDPLVHYGAIGAVALAVTVCFVVFVALSAKRRKKPTPPAAEALKDMLDRVGEFNEVAKVSYKKPVAPAAPQESAEEEKPQEEKEEPAKEEKPKEKQRTYDASLASDAPKADFVEHASFGELCEEFREFARQNGLTVEQKSIRALFSAIAASKIVIIDCRDYDLLPDFASTLNDYFMGAGVTVAGDNWNAIEDVLWSEAGDKCVLSNFVNTLYAAGRLKGKLCAAVVCNVSAKNLTDWFGDFIASANAPTESYDLELSDELSMPIPQNLSYILVPKDGGFDTGVSRALANASVHIKIHLRRIDVFSAQKPKVKAISCMEFEHLVSAARESNYLPEKVWKKLDEIFETIAAGEKFKFGNKNAIQAEKLTSVLMECGADESEALLKLLFTKVIPVLKLTQFYEAEGGDAALCDLFEKAFPEEDITKIRRGVMRQIPGEGETA